jgi:hypothetical protein
MNQNKKENGGKYESFNWTQSNDLNKEIDQMIDAMQRHILDLKSIQLYGHPIINLEETPLNHCIAIACDAMILYYKYGSNRIISRPTGS